MLAGSISSGLISFRIDWSPCSDRDSQLSSPGSQFKSINFGVLYLLYGQTVSSVHDSWKKKNIALTIQTFVGKVMSLIFNMLSRFVIAFLPKSNCPLISWLQSPTTVTLEPKKIICHWFHLFPFYFQWSDGTKCHDLGFFKCWVLS